MLVPFRESGLTGRDGGLLRLMSFSHLFSQVSIRSCRFSKGVLVAALLWASFCVAQTIDSARTNPDPGLLFYLSGDNGFKADFAAGGNPEPNFLYDVKILPGGAKGSYLQCGDNQLL